MSLPAVADTLETRSLNLLTEIQAELRDALNGLERV